MRVTVIKQRLVDACDEWLNGGDVTNKRPVYYGPPNTLPLLPYVVVAGTAEGAIVRERLAQGLRGVDEQWQLSIDIVSSGHELSYVLAETGVAGIAQLIIGRLVEHPRLDYDQLSTDGEDEVEHHHEAIPGLRSCEVEGYNVYSTDSPAEGITAVATLDLLAVCSAQ